MAKYSHISDIDVKNTAYIIPENMPSCFSFLKEYEPEPEPPSTPQSTTPPPPIVVSDVSEYECDYDARFPTGIAFHAHAKFPSQD